LLAVKLPAGLTANNCEPVEDATTKGIVELAPWIKTVAPGVVVPMPRFPANVALPVPIVMAFHR
jgi:hypothetical protein